MAKLAVLKAAITALVTLLSFGVTGPASAIKSASTWTAESPGAPAGYPTCENVTFYHRHFGDGHWFQDDQGDGGWWTLSQGELTIHWASDLPLFVGSYSRKNHEYQGTYTYLPNGSTSGDVVKGDDPNC
jgi:hypothetical protein